MALPSYARRFVFGGTQDQMTPEEAGFYDSSTLLGSWGEGRAAVLSFDRTFANAIAEDQAQISFEFVNTTGGVVDNTWTTGDFTTLEGYINTWWGAIKSNMDPGHKLATIKWYAFGPTLPLSEKGNELRGAPRRVTSVATAGTSVGFVMPLQFAISVTFKTATRRHWGRIYVPGCTAAVLDGSARITSAFRTTLGAATDALFDSASAADFLPVVYSPKRRKAFSIEAVQVDDIPDVIRRRRAKRTGARTIYNS